MPKYVNIAKTRVFGYAPGEEFEAELEPTQEARLLEGGHIGYVPEASDVLEPTQEARLLEGGHIGYVPEVSDGPTEGPCAECDGCPECAPVTPESDFGI